MRYTATYLKSIADAASQVKGVGSLVGKRVLITGCNGLICSAVTDMLLCMNSNMDARISIYAASRSRSRTAKRFGEYSRQDCFTFVDYDATKPFGFDDDVDFIIHGAGNADPAAIMLQPVETMTANISGTGQLLQYAARHKGCRLLYISSSEVYGKKASAEPYKETDYGFVDLLNPRSCYPSSKRAAETLCASYAKEYGTDAVIVRPGHIYGPTMTATDSRASSEFARLAMAGKDIRMKTPGNQLRSYCYVADCASALLTVMAKGTTGNAYNISNSKSIVTIRRMAQAFADAAGCRVVTEGATQAQLAAYNMMDNSSLDSSKIEALGWKALTTMSQGARMTIAQE